MNMDELMWRLESALERARIEVSEEQNDPWAALITLYDTCFALRDVVIRLESKVKA